MDRRGFFATLAALCAAPLALFRAPKAKASSEGMTLGRGTLNQFHQTAEGPVMVNHGRYYAHECEWRDLPERAAQQCLVCGDVRSRLKYQQDVLDAHLDAMWENGKPAHEIWGPALKHISGTRAP